MSLPELKELVTLLTYLPGKPKSFWVVQEIWGSNSAHIRVREGFDLRLCCVNHTNELVTRIQTNLKSIGVKLNTHLDPNTDSIYYGYTLV